jgi:hypothetical protein
VSESTRILGDWYRELGRRLVGQRPLPDPLPGDAIADGHLIDAVRRDLRDESGKATPTAVRMIWTGDYLDAVRRLQPEIVGPVNLLGEEVSGGPRRARTKA